MGPLARGLRASRAALSALYPHRVPRVQAPRRGRPAPPAASVLPCVLTPRQNSLPATWHACGQLPRSSFAGLNRTERDSSEAVFFVSPAHSSRPAVAKRTAVSQMFGLPTNHSVETELQFLSPFN